MRILITGCYGFMASHLVKMLLEKKYNVVGLDKADDTRSMKRLEGVDIRILKRDLSIENDCAGILENVDIVIHMAAETFVDHSIKNPRCFVDNNIVATFNLLEQARKYSVKKFFYVSTDEVYGSIDDSYFNEEDSLSPGNPYSATKAAGEMLCLSYKNTFGIPVIIARPENNYGEYQHSQKFIPTIIRKLLNDEPIPIYGDGSQCRMWLHVNDFCNAICNLIENNISYFIYNIGSAQEYKNIDVLHLISKLLNKSPEIEYIPNEDIRPGHDKRYGISLNRLIDQGWKPKYKFEEQLPKVVEWYVNNRSWIES